MTVKTQIGVLAMLTMAFAGSSWGQAQETVTASYNGYPVAILPDDYDTISVVFVTVPKAFKISKVTAKVAIDYPDVNDLNIYLYSPDGTRTKLLEHNCSNLRNVNTTFDDAASSQFNAACPAA